MLTLISFRKTLRDVANFNDLPEEAKVEFHRAEYFESCGFQELNGYIGRQCIWSCGGYWENHPMDRQYEGHGKVFHITSMGNGTLLYKE